MDPETLAKIQAMPDGPLKQQFLQYAATMGPQAAPGSLMAAGGNAYAGASTPPTGAWGIVGKAGADPAMRAQLNAAQTALPPAKHAAPTVGPVAADVMLTGFSPAGPQVYVPGVSEGQAALGEAQSAMTRAATGKGPDWIAPGKHKAGSFSAIPAAVVNPPAPSGMGGPKPGPAFNATSSNPGWGQPLVDNATQGATATTGTQTPNPQVAFGYAPTKGGATATAPPPITTADVDKLEHHGIISQATAETYRKKLAAGQPVQGVAQPSVAEVASGKGEAKSGQPNKIVSAAKGEGTGSDAPLFGVGAPAKPLGAPRSAAEAAAKQQTQPMPATPQPDPLTPPPNAPQAAGKPKAPPGSWAHAVHVAYTVPEGAG